MKMRTEHGKWIVEDNGRELSFDKAYDAWLYIFILREIRPKPPVVYSISRTIYPVLSLYPKPRTRKKLTCEVSYEEN